LTKDSTRPQAHKEKNAVGKSANTTFQNLAKGGPTTLRKD